MLRPSGPGAPRLCATSPNARIRSSSLATSSIVIAGRVSPGVVLDFGTVYRAEGTGRPVSVPGTAPCGLSAVSRNRSRWPARSLAVVAFPPRVLRAVGTAFRRPSGTLRPSDSSRLVAISSFVSRWLPPGGGSREVSSGKHTELRTDAVAYTPACPTDMGFTAVGQLTRRLGRLCGASLSLGSVLHHQTSTGRPLAGRTNSAPLSR